MLYTGKGDEGTTKFFDSPSGQRTSKKSLRAEALGTLDEINSFLGVLKIKSKEKELLIDSRKEFFHDVLGKLQQTLFVVQAEVAGAEKTVSEERLKWVESVINDIENEMPPIKSFFISGGTELGAFFDFSRTIARRAERRIVAGIEAEEVKIGDYSRKFLNRLSSILYALARYTNFKSGITEEPPTYSD